MKIRFSAFFFFATALSFSVFAQSWIDDGTVVRLNNIGDQVGVGTTTPGTGVKMRVLNKTQLDSLYLVHTNPVVLLRTADQYYYYTSLTNKEIIVGHAVPAPASSSKIGLGTAYFGNGAGSNTTIDHGTLTQYSGGSGSITLSYAGLKVKAGPSNPNDSTVISGTSIRTKAIYVGTSGWAITAPDYVFKKNYELMSLKETKRFIDENGHLPGVPSASALEKNGSVDLVEMNMVLLKKVEELTLHLIKQDRLIEELKVSRSTSE